MLLWLLDNYTKTVMCSYVKWFKTSKVLGYTTYEPQFKKRYCDWNSIHSTKTSVLAFVVCTYYNVTLSRLVNSSITNSPICCPNSPSKKKVHRSSFLVSKPTNQTYLLSFSVTKGFALARFPHPRLPTQDLFFQIGTSCSSKVKNIPCYNKYCF